MSACKGDRNSFSPEAYEALLTAFDAIGYELRLYTNADENRRHLILRHDIDFSLTAARAMAECEARLGVFSTYCVLLRTEFYNPLSADSLEALCCIANLGHAVGLHFDAALYPRDTAALERAAARECDLLANVLDRPVLVTSFHRPGDGPMPNSERFGGRINAYGPRFFGPDKYCSDSRGGWHHGHPLEHVAIREGRALQLLIHPFWWQAPALTPADRLRRFLDERMVFLDRELARHCSVHESN
jgi:hypothetical protein